MSLKISGAHGLGLPDILVVNLGQWPAKFGGLTLISKHKIIMLTCL